MGRALFEAFMIGTHIDFSPLLLYPPCPMDSPESPRIFRKDERAPELAVCGFESVKALARIHPEKIKRLFFTAEKSKPFGNACKLLAAQKRVYRVVEDEELKRLSGSVHHQGVVAMIAQAEIPRLSFDALNEWIKNKEKIILCDRVSNSQNFGAIIRSAAFFGCTKIVVSSEREQCGITTSAYRVARGGMEYVDIYKVSTAAWLLGKAAGKMTRIGASHRGRAHVSDLKLITKGGEGVILVFGNEENGLSAEAARQCDYLARIPGTGKIESLNVAQAAAVFIHELSERFPEMLLPKGDAIDASESEETDAARSPAADGGADTADDDSFPDLSSSFRLHRIF